MEKIQKLLKVFRLNADPLCRGTYHPADPHDSGNVECPHARLNPTFEAAAKTV